MMPFWARRADPWGAPSPFSLLSRPMFVVAIVSALVIGLAPPIVVGPLIASIALVVVGLVRPQFLVYLLGLAAPIGSVRELKIGDIGISGTEALVGLALTSYGLILLSGREERARLTPWVLPVGVFLAIGMISTGWAQSLPAAAKELLRWFELGAAICLVFALIRTRTQATLLIGFILLGGAAEGILGAAQFFLKIGPPSFEIGRFLRAYGTFGQPNPYAGFLGMVLPLGLTVGWFSVVTIFIRMYRERAPLRPPWFWSIPFWPLFVGLTTTLIAAGMAMSQSRGAWLGAAIGIAVIFAAAGRRTLFAVLVGGIVTLLVAFLGAFQLLPATLIERTRTITQYFGVFDVTTVELTTENWAIVERMAHWQAAILMWTSSPFLGVGIGQYAVRYEDFYLMKWKDALGHAHNYVLNVAAETGMVGLVGYSLMVGSWFLLAVRLSRTTDDTLSRAVGLGVLGAITATSVHNMFDNLYVAGMNVHIGVLIGLAASLYHAAQIRAQNITVVDLPTG